MYARAIIALGIAALTGCDRETHERRAEPAGSPPAASAAAASSVDTARREALEAEVRTALREALAPAVREELRRELTPIVREELRRELAASPRPPGAPDADAPLAVGAPDSADASDETRPSAEELWSRPGTRIWPSAGGLKLVDLRVGTALDNKLPTDVRTHYPSTPEILYCYTVFENPSPDATITHVWRRGSRLVSRVELEVGRSPKWRTWSKQRTQPHWTGLWSCEVLGVDGQQLGLTVFQIGG